MNEVVADREPLRCHLVEITAMPEVRFSLNLGYLQATAIEDEDCRRSCHFEKHIVFQTHDLLDQVEDWVDRMGRVDVLALSIYFWNRQPSLRLAEAVKRRWPHCVVVIGGNDVTNQADAVFAETEAVDFLVHGEGELTFRDLLKEVLRSSASDTDALKEIPGITFRDEDGTLHTVPTRPRITDLSTIPSPLLSGVYDVEAIRDSRIIIMETNRGCPYSCAFCYWGGATQSKVRPFPLERIKQEITYVITHAGSDATLFIADANFGIINQDVEIAKWLVSELRRLNKRMFLFTNWAKNTSKRVLEIADILYSSNLIAAVTLSAQSFTPEVLQIAKRSNIKPDYYRSLQAEFQRRGVPTYTEVIWGLPGETVESFLSGLEYVIDSGGFPVMYPLLLLNNTEYTKESFRQDHAVRTRYLPYEITNPEMQAEFVIEHARMTEAEWLDIMEFRLTMAMFHAGLLRGLLRVVSRVTGRRVVDLCAVLNKFVQSIPPTSVLGRLLENHRKIWTEADAFDRDLVTGITGTGIIPDHVHYQAIMRHILTDGHAEDLIHDAVEHLWRELEPDGTIDRVTLDCLVDFQVASVRALATSVRGESGADPVILNLPVAVHALLVEAGQLHEEPTGDRDQVEVVLDMSRFADSPTDSLLLAVYHGSVQVSKSFQALTPRAGTSEVAA